MSEKITQFFAGAAKAYVLFANEPKTRKISIRSGFENVGNAIRQSLNETQKTKASKTQ